MITLFRKIQAKRKRSDLLSASDPIFNEFQLAAEEAVGCLRAVVAGTHQLSQPRIDLLKELGFTSCSDVTSWERTHALLLDDPEKLAQIRYYTENYPDHKFILFDQINDICRRNNLLCIPVTNYRGVIPDGAVEDIVAFGVSDKDRWLSNYPFNIIEFNQSAKAIRRSVAEVKTAPDDYPGLSTLPYYMCIPKSWKLAERSDIIKDTRSRYECIVLHPVPSGFLMVTNWSSDI